MGIVMVDLLFHSGIETSIACLTHVMILQFMLPNMGRGTPVAPIAQRAHPVGVFSMLEQGRPVKEVNAAGLADPVFDRVVDVLLQGHV
ncbi:MAG: hypothetical protein M1834_006501 [Cirrosporium novae-zelandiae]|nr:MAG: hypothetical protein M1834_006501 [Cirrosporium novae-zelandiae]